MRKPVTRLDRTAITDLEWMIGLDVQVANAPAVGFALAGARPTEWHSTEWRGDWTEPDKLGNSYRTFGVLVAGPDAGAADGTPVVPVGYVNASYRVDDSPERIIGPAGAFQVT